MRQGTDAQGDLVSTWLFDPDGAVLEGPDGPVSHLVCGGVYDWSTGLLYKGGRYFDPRLGIWLALLPLIVVRRKKKRRGFPWVMVLALCLGGMSGVLTACGGGGTPPEELSNVCVDWPIDQLPRPTLPLKLNFVLLEGFTTMTKGAISGEVAHLNSIFYEPPVDPQESFVQPRIQVYEGNVIALDQEASQTYLNEYGELSIAPLPNPDPQTPIGQLLQADPHRQSADATVFYVPKLFPGDLIGYTHIHEVYGYSILIADGAARRTLAHEIGHTLLNLNRQDEDVEHTYDNDPYNPDNLMTPTIHGKGTGLTAVQVTRMREELWRLNGGCMK